MSDLTLKIFDFTEREFNPRRTNTVITGTQIEVTPEMIDAGFDALASADSSDFPSRDMVLMVFEAMILVAPLSVRGDGMCL